MKRVATSFRRRLWQRATGIATRIVSERASAGRIGWAIAVGVAIGTTPFFGLHLPICILVATLLGLNRAVTYLAANISIPPVAPFLAFASIQLGTLVQTGEFLPISFAAFVDIDPAEFFRAWLVGSLILGAGLGLPAGIVAYGATLLYRRRHPLRPDPLAAATAAVASSYRATGRWATLWTRLRLRHDPMVAWLAEGGPLATPVVDLGCGDGARALVLHALDPRLEVIGIDPSGPAIARAQRVADAIPKDNPGVRFRNASFGAAPLPAAGTILIIDRLRTLERADQDALLSAAAAALLPDGHLYIREIDVEAGARNFYAVAWDRLAARIGLRPPGRPTLRPASEIATHLEEAGLDVSVDADPNALSDVLITAHRPRADGA